MAHGAAALGAIVAAQALEVEDKGGHGPAGPNWAWRLGPVPERKGTGTRRNRPN
jgi:hypothetical protein